MNIKHLFKAFSLFCCITLASASIMAQQTPVNYWNNTDDMLQHQASLIFAKAYKILANHPPSASPNDERKLALFSIDAVLHDTRLDNGVAFRESIEERHKYIVEKLKNEKPKANELRIHQLYNHGFIVQSPSVTIGFDMYRGGKADNPFVSESTMQDLVNQCDILFVTHEHGDHADKSVVQMFCNQNKNVIAPPGVLQDISPLVKHQRGENLITEKINIPSKNKELKVIIFPGHQSQMLNNVYAVTTPEGLTVMHTGDQYNSDDLKWIARVGDMVKVDVLLVNCWTVDLLKTVEGIKPKLIITGHENEMGHSIDHREPYWLTFKRFENVKTPYIIMAWGEDFTLSDQTFAQWKKYENNPVLGGGDLGTVFDVFVLKDGKNYVMYSSWRPKRSVAVSTSSDGINWTYPEIVLSPNDATDWEDDINRPAVLIKDGIYHLWYTGQYKSKNSYIGYATSKDGKNFVRQSDKPVISPTRPWEKVAVMCPHVIWDEEEKIYKMWYSGGEQYEPDAIGYATSKDGMNWDKRPDPIFSADPSQEFEKYKVTACQVVKREKDYLMFYIGFLDINVAQIGMARSKNGIDNWERYEGNPIISPTPETWDASACYKPFAIQEKNRWMLWYNGRNESVEQIGLVIHQGENLDF